MAPEVITNAGHDFAADLWSLGIILYEMIQGIDPFNSENPIEIY